MNNMTRRKVLSVTTVGLLGATAKAVAAGTPESSAHTLRGEDDGPSRHAHRGEFDEKGYQRVEYDFFERQQRGSDVVVESTPDIYIFNGATAGTVKTKVTAQFGVVGSGALRTLPLLHVTGAIDVYLDASGSARLAERGVMAKVNRVVFRYRLRFRSGAESDVKVKEARATAGQYFGAIALYFRLSDDTPEILATEIPI